MTNYETLWTPSASKPKHVCSDNLPYARSGVARGTLIACNNCGKLWYAGYSIFLFETVWRSVRWYNVNSHRRVKNIGR